MRVQRATSLAFVCVLCLRVCLAEIVYKDSLEWMTADCDLIIRGTANRVVVVEADDAEETQEIEISIREVLKGKHEEKTLRFAASLPVDFRPDRKFQKDGREMLLFLNRRNQKTDAGARVQWRERAASQACVDLDDPGPGAITADMKVLKNKKDILELVRKCVDLAQRARVKAQPQSVEIEVIWETEACEALYRDSMVYMHVPADAMGRELGLKWSKSETSEFRLNAAKLLGRFADRQSVDALKTLLNDLAFTTYWGKDPKFGFDTVDRHIYTVRPEAYRSLERLGVTVEKPVLERKTTREEALAPLFNRARDWTERELLRKEGACKDWKLSDMVDGDQLYILIPEDVLGKLPADFPRRLRYDPVKRTFVPVPAKRD